MAQNMPVVQQSGGIGDIAQLLAQLGPLLGSGTTKSGGNTSGTQVSKSSIDGDSENQINTLIAQILSSVSTDNLDLLQNNILNEAKNKFGQTAIQGNAAGVRAYSDTTRKMLANDAMAKATAEAIQARLAATNAAQKTAATLVDSKMQATKSIATQENKQQQQQQKTGPNNAGKLLGLALPAAMIYNKVGGKQATVANTNTLNNQPEELGNPELTYQTAGNDSADLIIEPSESTIPAPMEFDTFTEADAAADAINTSILESGDVVEASEGAEIAEGAEVFEIAEQGDGLEEIFSEAFDAGDFGWFADGGVVRNSTPAKPGRRPAPIGSYTDETVEAKRTPSQKQSLARSNTPISSTITPNLSAATKTSTTRKPRTIDNATGEEIESGGSMGENAGPSVDAPAGVTPSAFGVGPMGLGLTVARAMMGDVPGAAIGLARMAGAKAAINKTVELFSALGFGQVAESINPASIETLGPIATSKLAEAMGLKGIDPETVETLGPIAVSKLADEMLGFTPKAPGGESAEDSPPSSAPGTNEAVDAAMGTGEGPPGDAPSSAPGSNEATDAAMGDGTGSAGSGAGTGSSAGDGNAGDAGGVGGGSSDGSDTAADGGLIRAKNPKESKGVDNKIIRVTPGEVVIPVDTVKHFGEDFFEELIAMTHTPIFRKAA